MKFNRRTNTVILWIISIGLLLGMIITFTPTLGRLGGGGRGGNGPVELEVNGQPIYQDAVARARQNQLYNAVSQGPVAKDLQLLLTDDLIQSTVLSQASAKVRVSGGQVAKAVDDFRKSRGVAGRKNDQAYLNLIGNAGFTDHTFREYVRQSLREQKWQSQVTKDVKVTDAEVKAWYETHHGSYQSQPQIKAREIVVNDPKLAVELQKKAVAGASFGALAKQYSKELANREGALGAAKGSTTPQPVGKPALPTTVANAAFGLQGPGITDVVNAAGQYYIIKVEQYLPAQLQPFDKVKSQVKSDALKAKQAGVVQQKIDQLTNEAKVTVPKGSSLSYDNPVVATVGDAKITAAQLDRAIYTNPQIQQALSPQSASLITQFFKPAVLGQLIDTYLADQGAKKLGLPLVGTRQMVAQAALNYVARDAKATQAEMTKYYGSNKTSFTIPAEADATRVDFTDQAKAEAFRKALLGGKPLAATAKADGGTVKDLGTVQPGDLVTELDTALFKTNAFAPLPSSKQTISDVLVLKQPVKNSGSSGSSSSSTSSSGSSSSGSNGSASKAGSSNGSSAAGSKGSSTSSNGSSSAGASASNKAGDAGSSPSQAKTKTTYVVLVAVRTPQRTRTFSEVKDQVRSAVLSNQQQTLRTDWLDKLRKEVKVVNLLAKVEQQQSKPAASNGSGNGGATKSASPGSGATPSGSASGSSSSGASGGSTKGAQPSGSNGGKSATPSSGGAGSTSGAGGSPSGSGASGSKSGN